MRALRDSFISDLKDGCLAELTAEVRSDANLCLELRGDSINVYYRGGNLMRVAQLGEATGEYVISFDPKYFAAGEEIPLPDRTVRRRADLAPWLEASPLLRHAIDRWSSNTRSNTEREFQQLAVRDNNFGPVARSTDYYFCDIEFHSQHGRFDMIAVHWPSESAVRKLACDRRLVFVEVKHGDAALDNLHDHVRDIGEFVANPRRLEDFKRDMVRVFNQKRELQIVSCDKDLQTFSRETPLLILMLANHDPQKSALSGLLRSLPATPHVDVRIATASFLGYGLHEQCVHPVQTVLERFGDYVLSPPRGAR